MLRIGLPLISMNGIRESQLIEAADLLLEARRSLVAIPDLPAEVRPVSIEEAWYIEARMAEALGPIGGWKVGAGSLEATPGCAPMPLAWIGPSGSRLPAQRHRFRGLEAEVAFLLKSDLPARSAPYSDEEVYAAVASCHPAIEVLESGLLDPTDPAVRMSKDSDLQMHGGFIYGPAFPGWQSIDFHQEKVALAIDGVIRVEATGSNTSGNLLRLLPWLANAGAARTGGLYAGQWITTGSWTGNTLATSDATADVHFGTLGMVGLRFE
jgi:2-keto-4-pentenoate hydratase